MKGHSTIVLMSGNKFTLEMDVKEFYVEYRKPYYIEEEDYKNITKDLALFEEQNLRQFIEHEDRISVFCFKYEEEQYATQLRNRLNVPTQYNKRDRINIPCINWNNLNLKFKIATDKIVKLIDIGS